VKKTEDLDCFDFYFILFSSRSFDDLQTSEPEWKELSGCQNVSHTECDFSSAITSYYDTHHIRIRAERREAKSPWSSIFEMIPYEIGMGSLRIATYLVKCPSALYCGLYVVSTAYNSIN